MIQLYDLSKTLLSKQVNKICWSFFLDWMNLLSKKSRDPTFLL